MTIEKIEFEKNEHGEDVRVTTMKGGAIIRELVSIEQEQVPHRYRQLSLAGWRRRFTREERVAIEIAKLDDPSAEMSQRQAAAALRSYIKDQEAASFIDLDDPDVLEGLQALAASGLIGAHRVAEIQEPDAEEGDRP
jgi:hypothetical protein